MCADRVSKVVKQVSKVLNSGKLKNADRTQTRIKILKRHGTGSFTHQVVQIYLAECQSFKCSDTQLEDMYSADHRCITATHTHTQIKVDGLHYNAHNYRMCRTSFQNKYFSQKSSQNAILFCMSDSLQNAILFCMCDSLLKQVYAGRNKSENCNFITYSQDIHGEGRGPLLF